MVKKSARRTRRTHTPAFKAIHAGRRHIRTLMLRMGIEVLAPQPGTSKAAPGNKIYPHLLRNLSIVTFSGRFCRNSGVWRKEVASPA